MKWPQIPNLSREAKARAAWTLAALATAAAVVGYLTTLGGAGEWIASLFSRGSAPVLTVSDVTPDSVYFVNSLYPSSFWVGIQAVVKNSGDQSAANCVGELRFQLTDAVQRIGGNINDVKSAGDPNTATYAGKSAQTQTRLVFDAINLAAFSQTAQFRLVCDNAVSNDVIVDLPNPMAQKAF
jgi:hypothetical protein